MQTIRMSIDKIVLMSSNFKLSYSQIAYSDICNKLLPSYRVQKSFIQCNLNCFFLNVCIISTRLRWSRPLLSLQLKYCLMILLVLMR